jgi:hypothetical protein
MAGFPAITDAAANPVQYGWSSYLPYAQGAVNFAVPGHLTEQVEADLFGTQYGASLGTGPGQWGYSYPHPKRLVVLSGANDLSQSWNGPQRLYQMAALINALLSHGFAPYGTATGSQPDFLIMTMLPFVYAQTDWDNYHTQRATSISDYLTNFGEIAYAGSPTNSGAGVDGAPAPTYTFTYNSITYPTISTSTWPAHMRCFINVDNAVALYASGSPVSPVRMDPKYSYTGDGLGVHLNTAGERVLCSVMTPYFLSS